MSSRLEDWVPCVYRFALRLSNDAHAAEDLTQETFLRAWRRRGRLREPRALRVWLLRITANLWRDQVRRRRLPVARAGPLEEAPLAPAPTAERVLAGREDLARALEALAALPPRQREVLYLSACEGLTCAEVAEVLGLSTDAAKASLSLARQKLRQQLDDLFPNPVPQP